MYNFIAEKGLGGHFHSQSTSLPLEEERMAESSPKILENQGRRYSRMGRGNSTSCSKLGTFSNFLLFLGLLLTLSLSVTAQWKSNPGKSEILRITRSSILRPTRVSYGDIEKTNKTCLPKDTCKSSRNDRNGAMMNDPKRRNCNCDQQCIVYEDCCVDSPYRRDPNVSYRKNNSFQCVTLRQFGSLYMKINCPASWKDQTVRNQINMILPHFKIRKFLVESQL